MGLPRAAYTSRAFCFIVVSALAVAWPQETNCPAYPRAARIDLEQAIQQDQLFATLQKAARLRQAVAVPPSKNFIDDRIFAKMSADNVEPAPLTTDSEFVRRIYLDLTGRIPTFEQAQAFLNDTASDKRERLIDSLLSSPAFVDQIAHWFLERFQVTRGFAWISYPERNNFYNFVRQFVRQDRPYNAFVRDLLTATGDADTSPGIGLLARQVTDFYSGPVQDWWDSFTDVSTTQFLGFKTDCISCHDGRRHLEKINLYLTPRPRRDFWRLSAFFSRTRLQAVTDDSAGFRQRLIFSDSASGLYHGNVDPSNPGSRPTRASANETPEYWFTDELPQTEAWRDEWARILTSDRQFARAAVNYLWAYFFGSGIVDPPGGWDLARVDPQRPPPSDWPFQNANPELLEALADRFVQSNHSIRTMIRLIVSSNSYQLSSRYPAGKWQSGFGRYFARHEARRLTAQQLFDSLTTATGTEPLMTVDGMPGIFRYANQLPHPRSALDFGVDGLLTSLGQGDWINQPPSSQLSLYGILDFFNNWQVALRTRAWSDAGTPQSRLAIWAASGLSDTEIIRNLFLSTLSRPAGGAEEAAIISRKQSDRRMWLTSVQWALLQKSDFVFNY